MSTHLEQLKQRITIQDITDPKEVSEILDSFVSLSVMDIVQSAELNYKDVSFFEEGYGLKKNALYYMSVFDLLCLVDDHKTFHKYFDDASAQEITCFISQVLTTLLLKAGENSPEVQRFMYLRIKYYFDALTYLRASNDTMPDSVMDMETICSSYHDILAKDFFIEDDSMYHIGSLVTTVNRNLYNNAYQRKASKACEILQLILQRALCETYLHSPVDSKSIAKKYLVA